MDTRKRQKTQEELERSPEPPARVYCICRQAVEDERVMIACDRCDMWFHAQCVHIEDSVVPLVDMYICPSCEQHTDARTSYKPRCARNGCINAARAPLSRYCSDACGMAAVYGRVKQKGKRDKLYTQVANASITRATAEWMGEWLAGPRHTAKADDSGAIASARQAVDVLGIRAQLLQHAEDRQSSLVGDGGALCGFDERLCWTDEALQRWHESGARTEGQVCEVPKRKCKRHADWSVIRGADIEVNLELQTQLLAELSERVYS